MSELFNSNLDLRYFFLYVLANAITVGTSVFFICYFDQIITFDFYKKPFLIIDYVEITLLAYFVLAIMNIFFNKLISYLEKEYVKYWVIKFQSIMIIISSFSIVLWLQIKTYPTIQTTPIVLNSNSLVAGVSILFVGIIVLYFSKLYAYNFKNEVLDVEEVGVIKRAKETYLERNIATNEQQKNKQFGDDPNDELIKRAEQLINLAEEQHIDPIGNVNLNIVIYIYGEGFDYCLLDSGLDIPFLFGNEDPEVVLEECHFLHINTALYFRVDQVYIFDFDENYVILNLAVDRNLSNIRSKRVREKLNSYRITGKPSGYFHIHPDLSDKLRVAIDDYTKKRFDN